MSKEYTTEQIKDMFLRNIKNSVHYWANLKEKPDIIDKMNGLIFSVLVMLDGGHGGCPAFIVATNPHPEDKQYLISEGENWFPENDEHSINGNITNEFSLHNEWANLNRSDKT